MGQGLRRASWSEGGGCGGAAGFSFGERPGSNGGSAGRWLLPFPGNGPGTGGVFLGRRGRAAAGRRASLSGRERVRTDALRGGGCCRSPETARVPAACFFVGGNRLRRGGEPLFRGEAGSDTFPVATAACHPCRCLPPRCLSLFPACYHPPPATSAAVCVPASACRPAASHQPHPLPCAGRADRWAAAAPRVVGRGAMRRRREVLRNNLENRKILPIFVSVKYRGSGLSRPGFLFFIGLSFLWQKRLSI